MKRFKKIILCRNPYSRFFSFYKMWIINYYDRENKDDIFAFEYLRSVVTEDEYNEFLECLTKDPKKSCNMYVKCLNTCIGDRHLIPQNEIYRWEGVKQIEFDYYARLEDLDTDFIESTMGVEFPHIVVSGNKSEMYKEYLNRESYDILNKIYKVDFEELGYEME